MSTTGLATAPSPTTSRVAGRRAGLGAALRWELSKLASQARARWALLFCLLAPLVIVVVINGQGRPPKDTLYGRFIHDSGFAVPLLVLGFAGQWVLPLLTAIVAGDIFASEDQHGTWKTILTRSASRAQIFWAKTITALAFAIVATVVLAASTIVSSMVIVGTQPLTGLTGQLIPSGTAARLVTEAWASALAPMVGFTCVAILLSIRTRSTAFGIAAPVVIALLMQLLGAVGGIDRIRPLLLTTSLESWHGLFAQPAVHSPLTTGLIVSAVWAIVALSISYVSLLRRDITGG
jgi:ABC-2 type transport system permease protein